jgi:hypothetical protein
MKADEGQGIGGLCEPMPGTACASGCCGGCSRTTATWSPRAAAGVTFGSRKPTRSCTSENDWFSEANPALTSENPELSAERPGQRLQRTGSPSGGQTRRRGRARGLDARSGRPTVGFVLILAVPQAGPKCPRGNPLRTPALCSACTNAPDQRHVEAQSGRQSTAADLIPAAETNEHVCQPPGCPKRHTCICNAPYYR